MGRKPAGGNVMHEGEVVKKFSKNGWIKPTNFAKFPKIVKDKVIEMNKKKKEKAVENGHDGEHFTQNVIYFRTSDVAASALHATKSSGNKIDEGKKVKFKLYTDNDGAGAYDIELA